MSKAEQLFDRWKSDYDFRTVAGACVSIAVTAVFALYNGFLGIYHSSVWHGSICAYYIVLAVLRAVAALVGRKAGRRAGDRNARNRVYLISSLMLLILNLSLVIPVSLMVVQRKPVSMTLIPAIAMAAYTTYKIVTASINLKRRVRSSDSLVRLLRTISFIDALVSILTLQNTLIMVNTGGGSQMLWLTASTSAAVMLAVLTLSVSAIAKGASGVRSEKKPPRD